MRSGLLLVLAVVALPVFAASERRGIEFHDRQDYSRAIAELQPLAEGGNAVSQYYLALSQRALQRRERGQGYLVPVEDDPSQQVSHEWFGRAAQQGHADAMAEYALDFNSGYGVPVDYALALEWMNKAQAAGARQSARRLEEWYREGHIVKPDAARADALVRDAQDADALRAARIAIGSQQQDPDARLAEAGNAEAALRLGNDAASIFRQQPDCPAAIRWYRRAGELGLDEGYYRLGIALSRGRCSQDLPQAQQVFALAAKTGHVTALKELARFHLFGHAGSPDYPQAYLNERLYQGLAGINDTPGPLAFARRHMSPEQVAAADAEVARQAPVLRDLRIRASQGTVRQISLGAAPADTRWSHSLTMTDVTGACARNYLQKCDYVPFQTVLALANSSESTLACALRLTFDPFGEDGPGVIERRIVMLPGASRRHGIGNLAGSVDAAGSSLQCEVVEKPSVADGTCTMQLPPGAGPTYPPAALRRGLSGVVRVEFLVPETRARPSQVSVVTSSRIESLDQAAVEFISNTVIHTNCPGVPLVAPVQFQLQD